MESGPEDTQHGYDQVAVECAQQYYDEMDHKPFDRKMLDWLAEKVNGLGTICDFGCGPGQIARYLHSRGFHPGRIHSKGPLPS
jgi:2-polyprenyl-3-methyl-5-hydroxy-6-metoxy-1,4-benzoquinol methylase